MPCPFGHDLAANSRRSGPYPSSGLLGNTRTCAEAGRTEQSASSSRRVDHDVPRAFERKPVPAEHTKRDAVGVRRRQMQQTAGPQLAAQPAKRLVRMVQVLDHVIHANRSTEASGIADHKLSSQSRPRCPARRTASTIGSREIDADRLPAARSGSIERIGRAAAVIEEHRAGPRRRIDRRR